MNIYSKLKSLSTPLIECIPNISEGKDSSKIEAIVSTLNVEGVHLLNVDSSSSANRTVVSFVSTPSKLIETSLNFIKKSLELIDMRDHHGVHPRSGAVDVFPIVPYKNTSIFDCILASKKIATSLISSINLPIYYYEYSSSRHLDLSTIRKGEYENLETRIKQLPSDLGTYNPKSGSLIIGARLPLIAYNINLTSPSFNHSLDLLSIVKKIATIIRTSGSNNTPGWLKNLKSIGWYLKDIDKYQVSCNLTNYKQTPLFIVYELVKKLALSFNAKVSGSELVGLIPEQALLDCYSYYSKKDISSSEKDNLSILNQAKTYLNLDEINHFDTLNRVLPN